MAENEKAKKAAEAKKAADAKKAAEDKKAAEAKARAKLLKARLKSTTTYPHEVVWGMRRELKAIEDGTWKPGWKAPRIPTAYQKFMES